jgi:aryl-alcohol dehydrogenase-like predicted oxidoreductase
MELARRKGATPIGVALAYVLGQSFPTFALIGPRELSETSSSMDALTVAVSADERRWLNLELESL